MPKNNGGDKWRGDETRLVGVGSDHEPTGSRGLKNSSSSPPSLLVDCTVGTVLCTMDVRYQSARLYRFNQVWLVHLIGNAAN